MMMMMMMMMICLSVHVFVRSPRYFTNERKCFNETVHN